MQIIPLTIILLLLTGCASAQSMPDALQDDHIASNVPSEDVFAEYLERDVLAYFQSEISEDFASVKTTFLRTGATQSGVAYPKFYLWVEATSKNGTVSEGAMRVAAVDRQSFDITHFLTSEEIVRDPQTVSSIFPSALVPAVIARATVK